jgi:cation diffusion facilitator family transporter
MLNNDKDTAANAVRRVTWLGAFVNVFLTGFKFIAGYWGNSKVLIADAVHSLSDLITDFAMLLGMRFWNRPADHEHPYGHAKIETLVTLFIGFVLALVGIGLLVDAVHSLIHIIDLINRKENLPPPPTWLPLTAALVSIALKEWLYRISVKVGMSAKSTAMIANAWHHRSDALSSIPAAAAVGACLWFGDKYVILDPVGTVVVSFMIIHAAWKIVLPTFAVLLDSGASELQRQAIANEIRSFAEVKDLHKLRSRYIGPMGLVIDVHVQVDPSMSVTEAHSLSHQIKEKLSKSGENIIDVLVHVEPYRAK